MICSIEACDGRDCEAVGLRPAGHCAPPGWLYLEFCDEPTGTAMIVFACSESCALGLWRKDGRMASDDDGATDTGLPAFPEKQVLHEDSVRPRAVPQV